MKKLISLIFILFLSFLIFLSPSFFKKNSPISLPTKLTINREDGKIFTPPPLRIEKREKELPLSEEGIILLTNREREKNGLLPMRENNLLKESATLKVEDMFQNQYFAHTSPDGTEVSDLLKRVGYEYILAGENLAMGIFEGDEDLVKAWMASEGHRANILNPKYQEIGVAVKKGYFQGKEVWLAVQHFAKPLSSCPQPDESLKQKIEENEKILKSWAEILNSLKREIENSNKFSRKELKSKIEKYNRLVEKYNDLLEETEKLIEDYNQKVKIFNQCLLE